MTGSLQIKNNDWYAVLNMKDNYGKRKPKWIPTGISAGSNNKQEAINKREANKALRDLISKYESKNIAYSKEVYFVDWVRDWVKNAKHRMDITTWEGYNSYFINHIEPYFTKNKLKLTDITPKHIQEYYSEKLERGRVDGKGGLSASSIKKHSAILNGVLVEAVQNELIGYNPCDRVKRPKPKDKFKGKFYTDTQANQLLEVAKGNVIEPLVVLALYYGLRRSEILGLKWSAVDFKNNTITIRNTITRVHSLVEKDRTKNDSSYRTMPLLPNVKLYLQKLKPHQARCQLLLGEGYVSNDYVCKWDDGRPISPNYASKGFKKLLLKNDMPVIRLHDLRHTCASLLVAMGFSLREVGEWLGHNDIKSTAIYAHLQYKAKVNMGNRLNDTIKLAAN